MKSIIKQLDKDLVQRGFKKLDELKWQLAGISSNIFVQYRTGESPNSISCEWRTKNNERFLEFFDLTKDHHTNHLVLENAIIFVDIYSRVDNKNQLGLS